VGWLGPAWTESLSEVVGAGVPWMTHHMGVPTVNVEIPWLAASCRVRRRGSSEEVLTARPLTSLANS
jgi:hypothetical protein